MTASLIFSLAWHVAGIVGLMGLLAVGVMLIGTGFAERGPNRKGY